MSSSPRMKFLTVCIGAALAQMAGAALADSGTGVDTVIGNAANPAYAPRVSFTDPNWTETKRSPSGQMYNFPVATDAPVEGALTGSVEAGYLYRNDRQRYSKLNEYSDPQTRGLYLNSFDLSYERADPFYFQLNGGSVGRDDQFYNLNIGQYNDWKVRAFYNETPHIFSNTWKAFWTDNGTSRPTANFVGGGTLAALNTAVPATSEIGLMRKKGGARLEKRVGDDWKFFLSATQEDRDGSRPWGIQNNGIEGAEPVHYVTRNFLAGLNYVSGSLAANVTAKYDTFQNDVKQFFFHRPTVVDTNLALNGLTKYSSYPDNSAWELKGELSYKLPSFWNSRFNAAVAFGQMRQDDSINTPLPADIPGVFVAAANSGGGVGPNENWNGVNGSPTSRATGGMKIDTELINLTLNMKPTTDLGLKASYRHWETKNKSGTYYAYNPLTGEWGYGVQEEGGGGNVRYVAAPGSTACLAPPGFTPPAGCVAAANSIPGVNNNRGLAAPPRSVKQDNLVLSANYSLGAIGELEGSFEREDFKRTYRERDKTWENKFKVGYVNNQGWDGLTVRATYEKDVKRGSFYDPTVSQRFVDSYLLLYGYLPTGSVTEHRAALQTLLNNLGVAGFPTVANFTAATATNTGGVAAPGGMMKTDQADRNQSILNFRLNYLAMDDLDIGFNTQLKRASYPVNEAAKLGSIRDDLDSYTLDFNYQPSPGLQLNGFYTRQTGRQTDYLNFGGGANLANTCGAAIAQGSSVNDVYCRITEMRDRTQANVSDTHSDNDIFGVGYQQDIGKMRLGVDYVHNVSHSVVKYVFAPGALTAANQASVAAWGGSQLPDMTTRQQTLEASLLVPIDKQWTTRLMYRYDKFDVKDWHYDYIPLTNAAGTNLMADMGPANFSTNTLGVFLKYKM